MPSLHLFTASALVVLCALLPSSSKGSALPSLSLSQQQQQQQQQTFNVGGGGGPSPFPPNPTPGNETGHGHFSEWSREQKSKFLRAVSDNKAEDWVIVMGNEAGGAFDSLLSSL